MSPLSRHLLPFVASVLLAFISVPTVHAADAAPQSAGEIASALSATRQDGSDYIRMRMEIGGKDTLQVQIKQRQTKGSTDVVYQILFPKERKGEAVLLRRNGGKTTGSQFIPPGTVRPIEDLHGGVFGSDLAYADVVENFFAWDQQALAGNETVDGVPCQILESKPGKDRSIYTSVKSWIDTRRMVPMRVEKYSGGQLVRRIDTTKVVGDAGHQIPANLSVKASKSDAGGTQLDGSRIKHDVNYTDHDFSPEALKDIGTPKGD